MFDVESGVIGHADPLPDSCDIGYFCTADKTGDTFCCPDGMDLAECAKSYDVAGGLVSQTPPKVTSTSTTSTSSSSSTAPPTTTTSSSTSTTIEEKTTSTEVEETSTSISTPSYVPSASYVPSNTTSISVVVPPSPSQSKITEGAGSIVGPTTALVFLAAGLAALL